MNSWPPRNLKDIQNKDPRLFEAITDLVNGVSTIAQQGNLNPNGNPVAPQAPGSMKVTGKNGHFQVSIQDGSEMYRGVNYQFEHSADPHFGNVQRVHMGPSRTHNLYLGNVTRYFRSQAFYDSSTPSPYVYHGSAVLPQPVAGGGDIGGPDFLDDEGSGTGLPGQPGGAGPVPFRSTTGAPPVRGADSIGGGTGAGSPGNPVISPSSVGLPAAIAQPTPPAPGPAITVPVSALVLASNATRQLIKAVLASGRFWLGNGSGAVAAVLMSGDATMDNAGAVTFKTVNTATPGTFGSTTRSAVVTVNGKGLTTASSDVAIAFPTSLPPSGAAGGGLNGTYPDPGVANIFAAIVGPPVLVAALPATPSAGEVASVSNALAPAIGSAVAGAGVAFAAVMWNGTQWTVFSI